MRLSLLAALFSPSPDAALETADVVQSDEPTEVAELGETIAVPDVIPVAPPPAETVDDWIIVFEMDVTDFWFEG